MKSTSPTRFDLNDPTILAAIALPDTANARQFLTRAPIRSAQLRGKHVVRDLEERIRQANHLADVTLGRVIRLTRAGQRVRIKDDEVTTPEQCGRLFTIRQVVGAGADAFVSLLAEDGSIAEWFRVDELAPPLDTPSVPRPSPPARVIGKPWKTRKLARASAIGKP